MTLFVRLTLGLGVVLAIFAGSLWYAHQATESSLDAVLADRREERARFFRRAIQLQGAGLEGLTSSYSWWDDMVGFMANPQPQWATDNIDNVIGVPNGGDALWVLTPEFELVHRIDDQFGRPPLPFGKAEELQRFIGDRYQFSFFAKIDGQLWQIFGAAIQDPRFWRHETEVQGYLLVGKRWDENWLARLGALTGARLSIASGTTPVTPAAREFAHALPGLDGTETATVVGTFETGPIDDAGVALRRQLILVLGALLLVLLLIAIGVVTLLVRPLERIVRSLETRNPLPLADLMGARNRFGEIARLLASHYRQGRMLQDEIRRHLAASNPRQQEHELESNESLRLRLASDLHDGPLQSIYAAGLKLGALEGRLTSGRAIAPAELEAIRTILTECTTNLRNLLFNLEPEELKDQDLEGALERLERYMKSFAAQFRLAVSDHALEGMSREAQLHVYYICREMVSNAARHSRPQRATLSFKRRDGFLTIEWTNDGILAPDRPTRTGNGLRNIEQRVKRLDGSWQYRVQRERLWVVTVEIPYTSLVGPITLDAPAN